MSTGVNLILSLAGSLVATSSLAAGEALRKDDEPFLRRITPRMLLSLAFLGSAVALSALEWLRAPEGSPSGSWLSLLLLAAGTGATLWAYASGPARRGNESLWERLTTRGKIALGLLTVALGLLTVAQVSGGQLPATLKELQATAGGSTSLLAVLGMVLVSLGTATAAATFRAGSSLYPGKGSLLKRLSPLAKGTLILLVLALGVVGLAAFLKSGMGTVVSLALLALGTTIAVFAIADFRKAGHTGTNDSPGPWGISPRGWVSLGILTLAGGVLGAQEGGLLGAQEGGLLGSLSAKNRPATTAKEPVGAVVDSPSAWSAKKYELVLPNAAESERLQLQQDLFEARKRVAALESGTRPGRPVDNTTIVPQGGAPVVDLVGWNHKSDALPSLPTGTGGGTDPARADKERLERLEKDLADARKKLAELEAGARPGRPVDNTTIVPQGGAPVVDLVGWNHKSDALPSLPTGTGGGTDPARADKERLERLEKDLADARKKLAELEAGARPGRPPENNASVPAVSTVDVSKWRHTTP